MTATTIVMDGHARSLTGPMARMVRRLVRYESEIEEQLARGAAGELRLRYTGNKVGATLVRVDGWESD